MEDNDRIEVENVSVPGSTTRLSRAKYMAMKEALLAVLPHTPPGITPTDAKQALLPSLSQVEFPGGDKAGWWLKAVQLDLEAKGIVARAKGAPVRLYRKS